MKYRARRRTTSFDVFVQTDDGKCRASIVDITEKGARLRLNTEALENDDAVKIALRGQYYGARVVWRNDTEAGVAFDGFLPLDVLSTVNRSMHRPSVTATKRQPTK